MENLTEAEPEVVIDDDTTEIDLSEVETLDGQKTCCSKMIDYLIHEEKSLKSKIEVLSTMKDVLNADERIKNSMGEYVGYNYGRINVSMNIIENAMENLAKFSNGDYDELDHGARGMFLNMWYNFGMAHVDDVTSSVKTLEVIESNMVQNLMQEIGTGQNLMLKGVTMH